MPYNLISILQIYKQLMTAWANISPSDIMHLYIY
jgi:hypothetical protein